MKNQTLEKVKDAIRHPFAWPGGYPVYTIMADGELMCTDCARENYKLIVQATKDQLRDGWQAYGSDVLYEGSEYCCHCDKELESAYGEAE